MSKKPLIAITCSDQSRKIFLQCIKFGIFLVGGESRLLKPQDTYDFKEFDGFIISGGTDINPKIYGQETIDPEYIYDDERDIFEQEAINYALDNNKPLFGICRGMQMINVTMGGTLYQEAKEVLENFLPSSSALNKFIGRRKVNIAKTSYLFEILGNYESYNVNSIHHQAVDKLGKNLQVVAKEENSLVQAIEPIDGFGHKFIKGVQWHPELMLHAASARNIFRAFIKACY